MNFCAAVSAGLAARLVALDDFDGTMEGAGEAVGEVGNEIDITNSELCFGVRQSPCHGCENDKMLARYCFVSKRCWTVSAYVRISPATIAGFCAG
jgi:hypothetical protein